MNYHSLGGGSTLFVLECLPLTFPMAKTLKSTVRDSLEPQPDKRFYPSYKSWISYLHRQKYHKENGEGFGYKILNPDTEVARTLTANSMGRYRNIIIDHYHDGINSLNVRFLTIREYARLQGFPDSFKIPKIRTPGYRQIGNSVAVPVVSEIAKNILSAMKYA